MRDLAHETVCGILLAFVLGEISQIFGVSVWRVGQPIFRLDSKMLEL